MKIEKINLTSKEVLLAISLALLGFIFSSREFILWMNESNPFTGFLIYYAILYVSVFILAKAGLVAAGFKIEKPLQYIGVLLIMIAFFITIDWESPLINIVTNGTAEGVSPIYFQSEDGCAWYLWSFLTSDTGILRMLTYVFTPFILAITGGLLVEQKIKILN